MHLYFRYRNEIQFDRMSALCVSVCSNDRILQQGVEQMIPVPEVDDCRLFLACRDDT